MFPSDIPHGHSNSSYRAVTVTIPWRKHKRLSGKQQRENHFVKHHQLSMPHRQYSMKKKEWMNARMGTYSPGATITETSEKKEKGTLQPYPAPDKTAGNYPCVNVNT